MPRLCPGHFLFERELIKIVGQLFLAAFRIYSVCAINTECLSVLHLLLGEPLMRMKVLTEGPGFGCGLGFGLSDMSHLPSSKVSHPGESVDEAHASPLLGKSASDEESQW